MKRSRNLKLTLMAVTLPVALTACESEPPTGVVLASSSDCYQLKEERATTQQCLTAYDEAVSKHQASAPRFDTRYQCDEQFGSCTPVNDGQGQQRWIPPMGGFLLGYALGNLGGSSVDCARFPSLNACRTGNYRTGGLPLYRDYRGGGYYRPDGGLASQRTGTVRGPSGSVAAPTRAITVSRAGFGSSAAARSSFSSSRSSGRSGGGFHFGG
ncbi:MAG TPA: DUF1190 domain-containing protein [Stenotrophomonas sp.]|jgi:uncharacterized protein YgiB involved in biofilm formation